MAAALPPPPESAKSDPRWGNESRHSNLRIDSHGTHRGAGGIRAIDARTRRGSRRGTGQPHAALQEGRAGTDPRADRVVSGRPARADLHGVDLPAGNRRSRALVEGTSGCEG